jgi:hypothetical protein
MLSGLIRDGIASLPPFASVKFLLESVGVPFSVLSVACLNPCFVFSLRAWRLCVIPPGFPSVLAFSPAGVYDYPEKHLVLGYA